MNFNANFLKISLGVKQEYNLSIHSQQLHEFAFSASQAELQTMLDEKSSNLAGH
jgi:hypothetical protein